MGSMLPSALRIFNIAVSMVLMMEFLYFSESLYVFPQYPVRPMGGKWVHTA